MKKGVISILILLVTIGLVNAASISDILESIDSSTMILYVIFILSFLIVFFALSKTMFKSNTTIAGIIAGVVAFLITYLLNESGLEFGGFLLNIGISESTISWIIALILIAGAIFILIKTGLANSLLIFGGLLIFTSFVAYEKAWLIIIGSVFILVGILLSIRKLFKKKNPKKPKEIYRERYKFNVARARDQKIFQEGRREEERKRQEAARREQQQARIEQQAKRQIKQLTSNIDVELKHLIQEYNRAQREDPSNSQYLIQLRNRIQYLKNEKKKVR